jgi:hypothetical protein
MTVPDDRLRAIRDIEACKGVLRHAWYPIPSPSDRKPEFGVYIANRCERCGGERMMAVGQHGQKITGWRYVYPDKVLYRSVTAESMDQWRERYIERMKAPRGQRN